MRSAKQLVVMVLCLIVSLAVVCKAEPMGTAWTYQGRLMDANKPGDGLYDFIFGLFDGPNDVGELGVQFIHDLDVIDGYFTVELDFGSDVFDGNERWLQIEIRQGELHDPNGYTKLTPRQRIAPTPYALQTRGVFVDGNGKVGIGATSPVEKLHIEKLAGSLGIRVSSDAASYQYINFGATNGYSIGRAFDDKFFINRDEPLGSGVLRILTVQPNGSVGIGTKNPTAELHIAGGGASAGLELENLGTTTTWGIYAEDLGHYSINEGVPTGGATRFRIYSGGKTILVPNGGKVGVGTITPTGKLHVDTSAANEFAVHGKSDTGAGVYGETGGFLYAGVYGKSTHSSSPGTFGENTATNTKGSLGGPDWGVFGYSPDGHGVQGQSTNGYGVYGESSTGYAGYFNGDVYVTTTMSAETVVDRTPYPPDLETAYEAVMSMERLPDSQYDENNKEAQLDHSMLSDFIRSEDGNRDLSATVSCHNEVLKDLIRKQQELGKANIYIEQLQKQNRLLQARLVKLEAVVARLNISGKGGTK